MRRAYFIVSVMALFLITSCTATKYIPYQHASVIDYWYLQERGMYVSESNTVNFPFETIGSVIIEVRSGDLDKKSFSDYITKDTQHTGRVLAQAREEVLERIYQELKALDANGIINIKTELLMPIPAGQGQYYGPGYSITGMAIQK